MDESPHTGSATVERGVSPVAGLIVLVAITVLLAAVMAAFVLGFAETAVDPPDANFTASDTATVQGGTYTGTITFVMEEGERIERDDLVLRGPDGLEIAPEAGALDSGESVVFDLTAGAAAIDRGDLVRLVWEQGDASVTLHRHELTDTTWNEIAWGPV